MQNKIRIFAGPNGSGKTTLYNSLSKKYNFGSFINADLIEEKLINRGYIDLEEYRISSNQNELNKFKKLEKSISLFKKANQENFEINIIIKENFIINKSESINSYSASFISSFLRNLALKSNQTFSYETVLSHPSKINEFKQAKKSGFRTYLYFLCTDDYNKNINRVKNRFLKGGHAVSEDKIIDRYSKSLENIFESIQVVDKAFLIDNSGEKFKLISEIDNGKIIKILSNEIPYWFEKYIFNKFEF
ncbi:MAG: hypothetical protein H6604_04080 [Flavobacteriales bacterium]|nr:hypothetical protein [Flavobacteriales bacterium]